MHACNYSLRSMLWRMGRFWAGGRRAASNSVTSASPARGHKGRGRHPRNERLELAISLGPALVAVVGY
jgi:hypothetical protein